jgi:uncharacterized protein involved in exopolysaccharide biosynthesis
MVSLVDSAYSRVQKERAQKAYDLVEREYTEQRDNLKSIEDTLASLSKLGVIDVRSQTEMYSEQYAIALSNNRASAVAELEKKLDLLARYGSVHSRLKEQMLEEIKRLSTLESKYREAKIDLEQDLPNTYVVSPAEKAEKKAKPVRMVIVAVSVLSSFLLALILLIFFDNYKKFKSKNN